MLSDTTCFTCRNAGSTKGIWGVVYRGQRVHDRYNWWTLNQFHLHWDNHLRQRNVRCRHYPHFNPFVWLRTVIHHEEFNCLPSKIGFIVAIDTHHKEFLNDFEAGSRLFVLRFPQLGHAICIFKFCWQFMEFTLCNRFGAWLRCSW